MCSLPRTCRQMHKLLQLVLPLCCFPTAASLMTTPLAELPAPAASTNSVHAVLQHSATHPHSKCKWPASAFTKAQVHAITLLQPAACLIIQAGVNHLQYQAGHCASVTTTPHRQPETAHSCQMKKEDPVGNQQRLRAPCATTLDSLRHA